MYNKDEDLEENYVYETNEGWIELNMFDDDPHNYYNPMEEHDEYIMDYE